MADRLQILARMALRAANALVEIRPFVVDGRSLLGHRGTRIERAFPGMQRLSQPEVSGPTKPECTASRAVTFGRSTGNVPISSKGIMRPTQVET